MVTITNDPIINYQVAMKIIGERQQPYIMAIENEKAKVKPDLASIDINQHKLDELFDLRSSLRIEDTEKIQLILNGAAHAI